MKYFLLLLCSFYAFAQRPELSMTQEEFDGFNCCWRRLSAEKHYTDAATLLEDYVLNSPNAERKNPLYWHTGQMYACAGDTNKAVKYMKKTYNVFYKWFGDTQWYYFAKANVAFIERDRKKLENIIAKWEKTLPKDGNYNDLLKLLNRWDLPYCDVFD
jgi:hypothetical protein